MVPFPTSILVISYSPLSPPLDSRRTHHHQTAMPSDSFQNPLKTHGTPSNPPFQPLFSCHFSLLCLSYQETPSAFDLYSNNHNHFQINIEMEKMNVQMVFHVLYTYLFIFFMQFKFINIYFLRIYIFFKYLTYFLLFFIFVFFFVCYLFMYLFKFFIQMFMYFQVFSSHLHYFIQFIQLLQVCLDVFLRTHIF